MSVNATIEQTHAMTVKSVKSVSVSNGKPVNTHEIFKDFSIDPIQGAMPRCLRMPRAQFDNDAVRHASWYGKNLQANVHYQEQKNSRLLNGDYR